VPGQGRALVTAVQPAWGSRQSVP